MASRQSASSSPVPSDRAPGCVSIEGLEVHFESRAGATQVLAETSLRLEAGTFTALIGPSGCGKSTILNAVAGFLAPTSGAVLIDGEAVNGSDPRVGIIFQQYALFPWLTALGNVKFALKRFGLSKAEMDERARMYLAEVGLSRASDKYPGQMSGGMKQRVAIARTLAGSPMVLLMDEPFGALDAQTRLSMHELLLRIWENHHATVLFVTHDVDEALLLADVVHVMAANPGRIVKTCPVAASRPRSVSRFDAQTLRLREELIELLKLEIIV
ncbi:ABC transporter ATP-binding protein [Bradyrhizobium sp. HKCCYLS2038]|uniref:ABC transporter ATP-binding protein n=1 Tax=unclassified Bradyrhizobium TaxID=2631580 RepID=UPI003EBDDCDD